MSTFFLLAMALVSGLGLGMHLGGGTPGGPGPTPTPLPGPAGGVDPLLALLLAKGSQAVTRAAHGVLDKYLGDLVGHLQQAPQAQPPAGKGG